MQSNNRGKRDMQRHEPTVIRTGCASRGDLTIYADGFLKGQAVAAALIGERLSALGFDGANALLVDTLESQSYRFLSKDDDGDGVTAPCPFCGRPLPPP